MKIKKAFTMIEVIITIVLFGIIAGIGAEIITAMYKNYIQSRTLNYLQAQSDITVEQIAKRLQYRIKDTTIARKNNDIKYLNDAQVTEDFNVIEWIGYSNEAMLGTTPGWSGFVDIYNTETSSTAGTIKTLGSNLKNNVESTINALNYGTDITPLALVFKHKPAGYNDPNSDNGYGWKIAGDTDINYIVPVSVENDTTFKIEGAKTPTTIYEHYHLAHTAYAIYKSANSVADDDFTLMLSYNYQPWSSNTLRNSYNAAETKKVILAENVNLFRVKQVGNTIRIKLCLHDAGKSGASNKIVACKEEVIF